MINPQDIQKVINVYGQTATLEVKSASDTYDPATGTNTEGSYTSTNLKVKFYDYSEVEKYNSNIEDGTRKAVFYHTVKPKVGDRITGVGEDVLIISVREITSGENVLCYICGVKE